MTCKPMSMRFDFVLHLLASEFFRITISQQRFMDFRKIMEQLTLWRGRTINDNGNQKIGLGKLTTVKTNTDIFTLNNESKVDYLNMYVNCGKP